MRPKSRRADRPQKHPGSTSHYKQDPKTATVTHTLEAPINSFSENFQESPCLWTTSEPFFGVKSCAFGEVSSTASPPLSQNWFTQERVILTALRCFCQGNAARVKARVTGSAGDSIGPKLCLAQGFGKPRMGSLPAPKMPHLLRPIHAQCPTDPSGSPTRQLALRACHCSGSPQRVPAKCTDKKGLQGASMGTGLSSPLRMAVPAPRREDPVDRVLASEA